MRHGYIYLLLSCSFPPREKEADAARLRSDVSCQFESTVKSSFSCALRVRARVYVCAFVRAAYAGETIIFPELGLVISKKERTFVYRWIRRVASHRIASRRVIARSLTLVPVSQSLSLSLSLSPSFSRLYQVAGSARKDNCLPAAPWRVKGLDLTKPALELDHLLPKSLISYL